MIPSRTSRTLILALGLCLLALPAAFAQQQVALVDIGDNAVIWNPLTADKMVLTVSGPSGDFRLRARGRRKGRLPRSSTRPVPYFRTAPTLGR